MYGFIVTELHAGHAHAISKESDSDPPRGDKDQDWEMQTYGPVTHTYKINTQQTLHVESGSGFLSLSLSLTIHCQTIILEQIELADLMAVPKT